MRLVSTRGSCISHHDSKAIGLFVGLVSRTSLTATDVMRRLTKCQQSQARPLPTLLQFILCHSLYSLCFSISLSQEEKLDIQPTMKRLNIIAAVSRISVGSHLNNPMIWRSRTIKKMNPPNRAYLNPCLTICSTIPLDTGVSIFLFCFSPYLKFNIRAQAVHCYKI